MYSAATSLGMRTLQQTRLEHPDCCIIALASLHHRSRLRETRGKRSVRLQVTFRYCRRGKYGREHLSRDRLLF